MASKRWKGVELEVALLFGARRNSLSGGNSKITRSDSLDPDHYIEVKHGKTQKMTTLQTSTWERAKKENKEPVIIQHPFGERIADSLATVRLEYLADLIRFYRENH